tara:strand:- start:617 stop:964 length:348 start_codon:yes stop_codon:yes gene_type:complete
MAIVEHDSNWIAYLLNLNNFSIENTLVSSKGYGKINNVKKKTTSFSHYLGTIYKKSFKKVEHINNGIVGLTNEFFLTYYIDGVIHDKKYIFLPESIIKNNKISLPLIRKRGIMIK